MWLVQMGLLDDNQNSFLEVENDFASKKPFQEHLYENMSFVQSFLQLKPFFENMWITWNPGYSQKGVFWFYCPNKETSFPECTRKPVFEKTSFHETIFLSVSSKHCLNFYTAQRADGISISYFSVLCTYVSGLCCKLGELKLGELLDTPPPGLDEAIAISKVSTYDSSFSLGSLFPTLCAWAARKHPCMGTFEYMNEIVPILNFHYLHIMCMLGLQTSTCMCMSW